MSTVEFTERRDNQEFLVTQKIQEINILDVIAPVIAERRKWVKYGLERNAPPGAQKTTTDVDENEVILKLFPKTAQPKQGDQQEEPVKKQGVMSSIQCRRCKGAHLTHTCPFKGQITDPEQEQEVQHQQKPSTPGAYVPPGRGIGGINRGIPMRGNDEDGLTLKVSNLPSDIDERMLKTAFSRVGKLARCHVAREKDTGLCRGFAFVSYETKQDAERARLALDGKAIKHLVIQVEYSKKRPVN